MQLRIEIQPRFVFTCRQMILETPRLTLRPFHKDDVDLMAQLFANAGFMRFSLGVFTKREQTEAFVQKVMGWDRAQLPSQ